MSREGGGKGEEKSDRGRGGVELLFPLTTVHNSRPGERGRGRTEVLASSCLAIPPIPSRTTERATGANQVNWVCTDNKEEIGWEVFFVALLGPNPPLIKCARLHAEEMSSFPYVE